MCVKSGSGSIHICVEIIDYDKRTKLISTDERDDHVCFSDTKCHERVPLDDGGPDNGRENGGTVGCGEQPTIQTTKATAVGLPPDSLGSRERGGSSHGSLLVWGGSIPHTTMLCSARQWRTPGDSR